MNNYYHEVFLKKSIDVVIEVVFVHKYVNVNMYSEAILDYLFMQHIPRKFIMNQLIIA